MDCHRLKEMQQLVSGAVNWKVNRLVRVKADLPFIKEKENQYASYKYSKSKV